MKKYALIGASSRCHVMFAKPIAENFKDDAKIVAVFDTNRTRTEYIKADIDNEIKVYENYDEMIRESTPDVVIIKKSVGNHGGGDERIQRMLFRGDLKDSLWQMAN